MVQPALLDFPQQIAGERIVVRPFRDEDAPELYEAIRESVEHIRPWMPWADKHETVTDTLEYIRRTQAEILLRENFGLGLFASETGRFLGGTGLHVHNWRIPAFEIGYWIRRSEEGKGYITESTRLVTDVAFNVFAAQRIMIRCDSRNVRSKAVPERLGYVFEGEHRHDLLSTDGELRNTLVYSLLSDEYAEVRKRW